MPCVPYAATGAAVYAGTSEPQARGLGRACGDQFVPESNNSFIHAFIFFINQSINQSSIHPFEVA